ncbi:MAG: PqqD family protein [Gammaproteobacteria bacterium]|nr:PqqD family protein [Gammaproteobacteria bacterium]
MNFFRRRSILKNANFLDLTPVRIIGEEIGSDNRVQLLMPKFINRLAQKLVAPRLKSKYIKIKLDELGSATWLAIDGKKNVAAIANTLVTKFGDKIQPVEERLTNFLAFAYQQKFISFAQLEGK